MATLRVRPTPRRTDRSERAPSAWSIGGTRRRQDWGHTRARPGDAAG